MTVALSTEVSHSMKKEVPITLKFLHPVQQQIMMTLIEAPNYQMFQQEVQEKLGMSYTNVQWHVRQLSNLGLVSVEPKKREKGKGRPSNLVKLTDDGLELFPKRYSRYLKDLINLMKAEPDLNKKLPKLLEKVGERSIETLENQIKQEKGETNLVDLFIAISKNFGHQLNVFEENGNIIVENYNCILRSLIRELPILCVPDEKIFSSLGKKYGYQVKHEVSIAHGSSKCVFTFTKQ